MDDVTLGILHPEKPVLHENKAIPFHFPRRLNILYPLLNCRQNSYFLILWDTRIADFPQPNKILKLKEYGRFFINLYFHTLKRVFYLLNNNLYGITNKH